MDVFDQDLLHRELGQLRSLQESGAALWPYAPLVPGDAVAISDGPFRGYRGTVLREQGAPRLIVAVSILRQSVAVEFDRSSLVRLTDAAEESRTAVA
jgi:transcription antitermination factor NusG